MAGVQRGGRGQVEYERESATRARSAIVGRSVGNLDLVPRLGCELEKMTSFSQKYLTGLKL